MKTTLVKSALILFLVCFNQTLFAQVVKPTTNKKNTVIAKPKIIVPKSEKITLENINEWYCPKNLLRGDREFDGNGPRIKCEVKIRVSPNGKEIWADLYIIAKETVHDWSTAEGKWSVKVYDAPYGKTINKIVSATASRTEFLSQPAGFQFLVPGADVAAGMNKFFEGHAIPFDVLKSHGVVPSSAVDAHTAPFKMTRDAVNKLFSSYTKGNTVYKVPSIDGTLVKFFHIVGDTGGDDISNDDNCNDDTRIEKIEFFPVTVEFK
jgi:hypothetical protein